MSETGNGQRRDGSKRRALGRCGLALAVVSTLASQAAAPALTQGSSSDWNYDLALYG